MSTEPGRHDEHSTYSASSAERWSRPEGCPASAILTKLRGPTPSSDAAEKGTRAHALLESMIKGDMTDLGAHDVDTQKCVAFAFDIITEMCRDSESWSERKWSLPVCEWLPEEDRVYGYSDFTRYRYADKRLDVLDYQHGVHVVEPNTAQLMQYAKSTLYELQDSGRDAEEIWLHIIQPNGYDSKPFKSYKTSKEELQAWEDDAVRAIESNAAYHFTGDTEGLIYRPCARNCHWCKGMPLCEAAADGARAAALPANQYGIPSIAAALDHADFMEVWIKEVRAIGLELAKGGAQIARRKLVAGTKQRQFIAEPGDVVLTLWELARVPAEDAQPRSLISPAQAEKLIRQKLKGDDLAKGLVRLAELVDKPTSDVLKLVPATDKGEPVDPRFKFFGSTPLQLPKPAKPSKGKTKK